MEVLEKRLNSAKNSLLRLFDSVKRLQTCEKDGDREFFRDSTIQRFEFTYEAFWKFVRSYMNQALMIDTASLSSARLTFQKARVEQLMSESEFSICMRMIEDRNQTSHTYDEHFADELVERIDSYAETMNAILSRIS